MDSEQKKGKLSERNRKFLEDWKKAQERVKQLPLEEQEQARKRAEEFVKQGTLNGRIR